jgi:hypothetical protein
MEKAILISLLEKYWQAETTVEEEEALRRYFAEEKDIGAGLEGYRALFAYYSEETRVSAGADLGERILQRLGIAEAPVRAFRWGVFSAAAAIVLVVVSVFLLQPQRSSTKRDIAAMQDTYEDPEQALAAVRHALLVASTQLNKGREQVTGESNRP